MAPINIMDGNEEVSSIGDSKTSSNQIEDVESGTKRAQVNEERVILTEQDVSPSFKCLCHKLEDIPPTNAPKQNKLILRKTDNMILTILVWVYFLQVSIARKIVRSSLTRPRSLTNQSLDMLLYLASDKILS